MTLHEPIRRERGLRPGVPFGPPRVRGRPAHRRRLEAEEGAPENQGRAVLLKEVSSVARSGVGIPHGGFEDGQRQASVWGPECGHRRSRMGSSIAESGMGNKGRTAGRGSSPGEARAGLEKYLNGA